MQIISSRKPAHIAMGLFEITGALAVRVGQHSAAAFRSTISIGQPFRMMRWFSVLSLFSIGALCITSSYLLSKFLTQHMLHRDGVVMQEFVQAVADIEASKSRTAGRQPDIRDNTMRELFDHLAGVPGMTGIRIYAPDHAVAWSSGKSQEGGDVNGNENLASAFRGEMIVESHLNFVETYLPLRDSSNGQVMGVAQLLRAPTTLFQTIHQGQKLIWLVGISSGLCLYLILFWVVLRADRVIRNQQSRLIESETLAAVGEMGSAVAHGIRNPLASIRSCAELCLFDDATPQVRESANDIIGQVVRLEKWVRDLLTAAQKVSGPVPDAHPRANLQGVPRAAARTVADTMGAVALGPVINRVCQNFSRDFAKRGIVPSLYLPSQLPSVAADEAPLEQVFSSILANAMEAMPQGGKLTIVAGQPSINGPVVITVSDTGVGICKAQKAKLFMAFQTSKPKGMGLGLALVRRILTRFGGKVKIDSVFGKGTQVELTFARLTTA
jgi:two-component system, NtrC family, sensor histidine kinase HydH